MKPFNLEKALAGEPVVTRDGRTVKIAGYNPDAEPSYQLAGWKGGLLHAWDVDGTYNTSKSECFLDLFMAENPKVKKEGWVNVYPPEYPFQSCIVSNGYISEEDAKKLASKHILATVKIEWEEEV